MFHKGDLVAYYNTTTPDAPVKALAIVKERSIDWRAETKLDREWYEVEWIWQAVPEWKLRNSVSAVWLKKFDSSEVEKTCQSLGRK